MVNGNFDAADNAPAVGTGADFTAPAEALSYEYRASLLGAGWHFSLTPAGIDWSTGSRSGFIPYGDVRGLRLSYRPSSMQSHRFVAEVWALKAPALRIVSTTWKSMVEQQRQDAAYTRFVTALHARLTAAGVAVDCERGRPPLIYWPGLVVFVGVSLAMVALIVRALQAHVVAGAIFVAIFFALFVRQGWMFFGRNRPSRYRVNEPPPVLLPKG
jgi:hypothetical protein